MMSAAAGRGHSCQPLTEGIVGRRLVQTVWVFEVTLTRPLPNLHSTSVSRSCTIFHFFRNIVA